MDHIKEVRAALEQAAQYAAEGDFEYAHAYEKDAWEAALTAIAEGAPNASEIAKLALTSRELKFGRFYA